MQEVDPFERLAIASRHMPKSCDAHLLECTSAKDHRLHNIDDFF